MAPHSSVFQTCLRTTVLAVALSCAGACAFQDVRESPPGVYALDPVDESRIPVLFVHGINDSPARFSYLIEHLDRMRFQPWMYSYPSDVHLAAVADDLQETMLKMRRLYRFHSIAIVGHSMGGLVARGFILRNERKASVDDIPLFVSISTPWEGHAAAALGARFAPDVPDVWHDIAPGSEYLRSLFEAPLPERTRHYLLFTFHRRNGSFGASGDHTVTVASQLADPAQREAARVYGFDDTHVGVLRNPELASLLNQLLNEAFPSPGSGIGEMPSKAARTESERDDRDTQHDRIASDQPEQRQGSRPGPGENENAEHDRNEPRKDEPQLAPYLLAKPDCAEDLEQARGDRPERDVEEQHETRHRGMHECKGTDRNPRDAGEHKKPPVLLLLAAGKPGDQPDRAVDEKDRSDDEGQGDQ